jgi:hypothetical protein
MSDAPVTLNIHGGVLHIDKPRGFDRASLLGALDIPIAHVVSVAVSPDPVEELNGMRVGIGLPHLRMGTWKHDGVSDYVAVYAGTPGLVISLTGDKYARVIVSIDDPEKTKSLIEQARAAR